MGGVAVDERGFDRLEVRTAASKKSRRLAGSWSEDACCSDVRNCIEASQR
jgi:hypothetical protein